MTKPVSYPHKTANKDLQVTKDVCCVVQKDGFSESFAELVHMILRENNLQLPTNDVRGAEHLYIDLLGFIEDLNQFSEERWRALENGAASKLERSGHSGGVSGRTTTGSSKTSSSNFALL